MYFLIYCTVILQGVVDNINYLQCEKNRVLHQMLATAKRLQVIT